MNATVSARQGYALLQGTVAKDCCRGLLQESNDKVQRVLIGTLIALL